MSYFYTKILSLFYSFIFLLCIFCQQIQASIIDEHSEATGSPIVISGINTELKKNLVAHLEIVADEVPFSLLGFPRSNEYILRKSRQALQALGYYEPTLILSGDHGLWKLDISPGLPLKWTKVDITLSDNISAPSILQAIIKDSPIKVGAVVNHGIYDEFKSKLELTANQLGYLDATYQIKEFQIQANLQGALLKWHLDLGLRYRIASIEFSETELNKVSLQKYLKLSKGDYYDFEQLLATQQQLNRSGYFSSIIIDKVIEPQTQMVKIVFNCTDRQKYQLKSSIGFGTDSGGRFGLEWQDRRVNTRGHQYSINLDYSNINRGASFNYRIPLATVGSEWINRASYQIKDQEVATSKITTIESRYINKLSDYWTSQYAILIATEEVSNNEFIESQLEYLIPIWQLDYYSTKDPFRAENGLHWRSIVRLSDEQLSNPALNFLQWEQQFKWLHSFDDDWRLLTRTKLGATFMGEQSFLKNMPISYRFFAGGDTSIRGYHYQTLAPTNELGELLGGKHIITQTVEVDYRFADNWRWALFTDLGNAFNDSSNFKVSRSIGTGFRWVTPVGSIRFDVAKALDYPNDWRIHITIGPDL